MDFNGGTKVRKNDPSQKSLGLKSVGTKNNVRRDFKNQR